MILRILELALQHDLDAPERLNEHFSRVRDGLLLYSLTASFPKIDRRLMSKKSKKFVNFFLSEERNLDSQKICLRNAEGEVEASNYYDVRLAGIIYTMPDASTKYPKLYAEITQFYEEVARSSIASALPSLKLYNEMTYKDYFSYFLECFAIFKNGMDSIRSSKTAALERGALAKDETFMSFHLELSNTVRALQAFTKGTALKNHLRHNARLFYKNVDADKSGDLHEPTSDGTDNDDYDIEFEAAMAADGTPIRWLELMLGQVDATDALVHEIRKLPRHTKISAEIIVCPPPSPDFVNWNDLFGITELFPFENVASTVVALKATISMIFHRLPPLVDQPSTPSSDTPRNKRKGKAGKDKEETSVYDMIQIIVSYWVNVPQPVKIANDATLELVMTIIRRLNTIIRHVDTQHLPRFRIVAQELMDQLGEVQELLGQDQSCESPEYRVLVSGIISKVVDLWKMVNLFHVFLKTCTPSKPGHPTFKGAIHCEVALANHIYNTWGVGGHKVGLIHLPWGCH